MTTPAVCVGIINILANRLCNRVTEDSLVGALADGWLFDVDQRGRSIALCPDCARKLRPLRPLAENTARPRMLSDRRATVRSV